MGGARCEPVPALLPMHGGFGEWYCISAQHFKSMRGGGCRVQYIFFLQFWYRKIKISELGMEFLLKMSLFPFPVYWDTLFSNCSFHCTPWGFWDQGGSVSKIHLPLRRIWLMSSSQMCFQRVREILKEVGFESAYFSFSYRF